MAQLTYVGQGQQTAGGSLVASLMLVLCLVFALLGIKIWGFRRRLTFTPSGGQQQQQQQSQLASPRYAAYESQVTGSDNAVQGVFRQRNTEEFESASPTNSTANNYLTGSVPNLHLATRAPYEYKKEMAIPEMSETPPFRPEARRRRREVHSASYDYYTAPPTREPPAPPIETEAAAASGETTSQLDMPAFNHFAEKYKLISAKPDEEEAPAPRVSQLTSNERGRYVKYEQVDDVPELLTPDDENVGTAISVAAQVHHSPHITQPNNEPAEAEGEAAATCASQILQLEHTDSAFVVEIIAGTPDSVELTEPSLERNLFANLEIPQHVDDAEFERIRSTYEMNEADILDMPPDFAGLQVDLTEPSSPPGFGKSIDDDWENFENLENVSNVPDINWLEHPEQLELPQQEIATSLERENVVQPETLFQQLELMEPSADDVERQPVADYAQPPPYEMEPAIQPILPDYDALMQLEKSHQNTNLPNYADAVSQRKGNDAKYVSSIEDLFAELQVNGEAPIGNCTPHTDGEVHNFDELCEELEIVASPIPARRPPQPAPRVSKPTTLSVRGDAAPLTCYAPEELPSSSSSDMEEVEEAPPPAPQPAKRTGRTLKVRFDVDNLQYYQSAEVPSSSESEVEYTSESQLPARTTQRLIPLLPDEPSSNAEHDVPMLFGNRVSLEDSDDETFGRAIREHRSMTEALRPVARMERSPQSDRITEA
ncbi:uncharacterized protein LOC6558512 [Drosophila grimshawi]|uniref:GH15082 n=1 Tax=Drosophila grimshawi TaxID=7222 RepID=B4IZA7_DROGR|nr:uncharacterized protein LOC6558512 [Drosophila grimshawi]EDV96662.1 GH15082 [Drosophila grimshawi]